MIEELIQRFYGRYPLSGFADIVKLVYQNEFAGGHLIADEAASLAALKDEIARMVPNGPGGADGAGEALFEDIGGGLCRMNLRPAARSGLDAAVLHRFFAVTAGRYRGDEGSFRDKLSGLLHMCETGALPFDAGEAAAYLEQYRKDGCPAVSHTARYREAYRPSYRIVDSAFRDFFALFVKIGEQLASDRPVILAAIDGNSGAGKSRLGGLVRDVYGCNLFHADDFFLRPEQRTPERLSAPGGNVDAERFEAEVYSAVAAGRTVRYRSFDCAAMALGEPRDIPPRRLNVVEGAYSLHPALAGYCSLKVFLKISPEKQAERILARNGPAGYRRFAEEWIPKENLYFRTFDIERQCDLVFDTSGS